MGVGESVLRRRDEAVAAAGTLRVKYCIVKVFKNDSRYHQLSVDSRDVLMQVERAVSHDFNNECQPTKYGYSCDIHIEMPPWLL